MSKLKSLLNILVLGSLLAGTNAYAVDCSSSGQLGANSGNTNSGEISTNCNSTWLITSTHDGAINSNEESGVININNPATTSIAIISNGNNAKNINSGHINIYNQSNYGMYSQGLNATNINSISGIINSNSWAIYSLNLYATNINHGSITTSGDGNIAIWSKASDSKNTNTGTISTSGESASGIVSEGSTSTITNSGKILTSGVDAYGVYLGLTSTNSQLINSGTISTSGGTAIGISSEGNFATITNNGTITTSGSTAWGIKSTGSNSITINNGTIVTSGIGSDGLKIYGNNSVINNNGTITTSGNTANGILSVGNNIIINNSGLIRIADGNSTAITLGNAGFYGANSNTVNLLKGSIIVGDIHTDTGLTGAKLNFNLGAGASYDYSVTGPWTIADLNNRPMVTGSAHAAGIGNVVTTSQSMYERTSQISQSIDDRLRIYDLKQNTDQPYWINTYYSDSGRGGQGLLGSNLSFNQYRSGVTAGFNMKNSYTPTELIVNYEHGQLNIDEGNQGISSNSVMAGLLFPDMTKVFTGTLSAKAFLGYSDYSGDRKVLTNDVAYDGSRNVTASYQSTQLNLGTAWTKTLYQTDKVTLDTLVGMDLNTQHINAYSESDLFKWHGRTINQLQERAQVGMEMKPFVNPLTLFGRIGIERRDLISGENQNFSINNTEVSYKDTNQRNTYATFNAGAYYPLTPTVKAYAQVRYYDSTKNIDSLAGSVGVSGQF